MFDIKCKPVQDAHKAMIAAQKAMVEAVRVNYPVGTCWLVSIGRHKLTLKVTDHSSSHWASPGQIRGENVKTGNMRNFHPIQIIGRAEEE